MWCIKCQADVAAEMAPDNRRILCASCGSQIRTVPLLPSEEKTQKARELLERWSKNRWSEEPEPAPEEAQSPIPSQSTFRLDKPHPDHQPAEKPFEEPSPLAREFSETVETPKPEAPTKEIPPEEVAAVFEPVPQPVLQPVAAPVQRTHEPHSNMVSAPHFPNEPLPAEVPPPENTSAKMQAFWGQMLAYAGVLALTIGAGFVLLGYFGGPQWQSYSPTGWLITTTGQMLLFLGVVTLVSGGMEQTTEEVARRIDRLGQRIIRIEWASQNHALKGPSLPAEHFQTGEGSQTHNAQEDRSAHVPMQDERR